jgi:putative membrane protein
MRQRYRRFGFALLIVAVFGLAGCGGAAGPTGTASPQQTDVATTEDRAYLIAAHESNLMEIAAGRTAQAKGATAAVRDLGADLVADHSTLDRSLRQLAHQLGVPLPSAAPSARQTQSSQYSQVTGADFDRLFVTTQMTGHDQALRAANAEGSSGGTSAVKVAALATVPVIERHITMLNRAAADLNMPRRVTIPPATPGAPSAPR